MLVFLTRNERDSLDLNQRLYLSGIESIAQPLVKMTAVGSDGDIAAYCSAAGAVIVTSKNAIRRIAVASSRRDFAVYAVGRASAEEAIAFGYKKVVDCSMASSCDGVEAIIDFFKNKKPTEKKLVYFSGEVIARDISDDLAAYGYEVRRVVCYGHQDIAKLSYDVIERWHDITDVPLFSSASAKRFITAAQSMDLSSIRAWAFSDNIAMKIKNAGFKEVHVLERANVETLLAALSCYKNC